MAEAVTTIGLDELQEYIRSLPEKSADVVKQEVGKSVLRVQSAITSNFVTSGGFGGSKLHSRTGLLRRSIKTSLSGETLLDIQGSVYTDVVYAPIQEKGGEITAKRAYASVPGGPYLNIPLSANRTASGVARKSARDVFNEGGYLFKSLSGKWFVGLNGRLMFVLKKSVTIPARLGMVESSEADIPTLLSAINSGLTKRFK